MTTEPTTDTHETLPALRLAEAPGVAAARAWLMPPANLGEAMRVAELLSKSSFVPADYRGKAGDVLCAIQYGAEIGVPPLQALQGVAVVNGKPSVYGDLALAVVQASGMVEDFAETIEGEGDQMRARCRGIRRGRATPIEHTFSVADAKTARLWGKAGPWTTNPKRMLQMRARAFVLRDGWADYLKGLSIREEAQDLEVPAVPVVEQPRPAGDATPPAIEYITDAQRKDLFKAVQDTGRTHADLKVKLEAAGIATTAQIPAAAYPALLDWARDVPADLPPTPAPGQGELIPREPGAEG